MRSVIFSLVLGGLFAAAPQANALEGPAGGLVKRSIRVGDETYSYQVYAPAGLRAGERLPVITFLHGVGQRGEGGFVPAGGTAGRLARGYLERVPAIILLPQCREGKYWHHPEMERMVWAMLDRTVEEFGADERRLYLAGVSMGGFGAWYLAARRPGRFAAVVPICGGSPLKGDDRYAPIARWVGRTPVWVFHGEEDRVVPVTESRRMVEALRAVEGSRVRYSEYKGVGHNVWLNALAEPGLMPWLFEQRLEEAAPAAARPPAGL